MIKKILKKKKIMMNMLKRKRIQKKLNLIKKKRKMRMNLLKKMKNKNAIDEDTDENQENLEIKENIIFKYLILYIIKQSLKDNK